MSLQTFNRLFVSIGVLIWLLLALLLYSNAYVHHRLLYVSLTLLPLTAQILLHYGYLSAYYLKSQRVGDYVRFSIVVYLGAVLTNTGLTELLEESQYFLDGNTDVLSKLTVSAGNNLIYSIIALLLSFIRIGFINRQKIAYINTLNQHLEDKVIRLRLSPHFLFNNINNISSLIDTDPTKAKTLLIGFGELLRYLAYTNEQKAVPMEQEIDYLQNYINLRLLSFDDTIDFDFMVDIDDYTQLIKPFLLVNYFENVFKHAQPDPASHKLFSGYIRLKKQVLHLDLSNFAKATPTENRRGGSGLGNSATTQLLTLNYPNRFTETRSLEGGYYQVKLTVTL